jgi:tripartite-type tricarboxylate transporter receptor subunit TctC
MRALIFAILCFAGAAAAQYPSRAITIIVPIPPGGAPDIAARVIAQKLSENVGQAVVVENRVGANGNIANELVARAAPDGYTMGLLADSQITINPHLYKMPIDTLKDLTPVTPVAVNQFVLTVNPSLPVKTFPEFIEYAKKASPPLAYASGGNGSQHHLTMEMLKQRAGINMLHVPYKGGAPAAAALAGGDIPFAVLASSSVAPQVKAGRLRVLAVTGAQPSKFNPEWPTLQSQGVKEVDASNWTLLLAPKGTPKEIVDKLQAEVAKILAMPDVKERFAGGGVETIPSTGAELDAKVKKTAQQLVVIVDKAKIKPD